MRDINRRLLLSGVAALGLAACNKAMGQKGGSGLGDEIVLGNPNAKVTVVEYASASCSHCAEFHRDTFEAFKKKYIDTGKVKFVFREFLTTPVQVAAAGFLLARCGGTRERYFDVLGAFYRAQPEIFQTGDLRGPLVRIAQNMGMNEQQMEACVRNEDSLKALNARVERAAQRDKIEATPTFVINGEKHPGVLTLEQLDAMIAKAQAG
ncbi:MAG TPA: DsbA family protein [Caulobacteraceae bacterium]|jgi:protein-disulfide isomerase